MHPDNLLRLKMTCEGSYKFGITKQLCDNAFWQGWSLNHRDIWAWVKEHSKESLTSYSANCISSTNGYGQFLFWNLNLWPMIIKSRCVSLNFIAMVFKSYCLVWATKLLLAAIGLVFPALVLEYKSFSCSMYHVPVPMLIEKFVWIYFKQLFTVAGSIIFRHTNSRSLQSILYQFLRTFLNLYDYPSNN